MKNKKNICLAELRPEGVSCALTEQKCDKVPQYKNTDVKDRFFNDRFFMPLIKDVTVLILVIRC